MSHNVKSVFVAISVVSVVVLAGCGGGGGGGDASCSDACHHLFDCADHLGYTGAQVAEMFGNSNYDSYSDCLARCDTGTCPHQQELLNCAVGVTCGNIDQVIEDVTACYDQAECTP